MPYDDPDSTDPMALHGVAIETEDNGALLDMAECFVEEYLRSGFDAQRIEQMFKTRGYVGPFLAYQSLGEQTIRRIIDKQMSLRNHDPSHTPDGRSAGARISLPVLGH